MGGGWRWEIPGFLEQQGAGEAAGLSEEERQCQVLGQTLVRVARDGKVLGALAAAVSDQANHRRRSPPAAGDGPADCDADRGQRGDRPERGRTTED